MDLPDDHAARNDAVFREANEGIKAAAEQHGMADRIPFICECADSACTKIVQLSLSDYETIRDRPRHFLVATGHESTPEHRTRVIQSGDGYDVIEKLGIAGDVAEQLDPRSDG
jgi:hypothetical protein